MTLYVDGNARVGSKEAQPFRCPICKDGRDIKKARIDLLKDIGVLVEETTKLRLENQKLKKDLRFKDQCNKVLTAPVDGFEVSFQDSGSTHLHSGDEVYVRSYVYVD